MTLAGASSLTRALARSLLAGLALLWILGVLGSVGVLKRLVDESSDDELRESAAILMTIVRNTEDPLTAAAILAESLRATGSAPPHHRFVYQVRDRSGLVVLRSETAPPGLGGIPLKEGLFDAQGWRVVTIEDASTGRFLQLADSLAERREALVAAVLWLALPLAALLAFAAYIVFRASRTLTRQVQQTAIAVSRQDPQAIDLVPLEGVVTEMKPAVEATNRLLARFADALEAERSFTYNSAHEMRTPIAAALAQAQLLRSKAEGTALAEHAATVVKALSRLAGLAERLLALARAEGSHPLTDAWVDLARVVRLTSDEFTHDARLRGRRMIVDAAPARVRGDLDAVGLAYRNLVENALVHGADGSLIQLVCGVKGESVYLGVIDDGCGARAEDLSTLSKRFTRGTAAAGDGAGLGLSIADTLARRMDARLVLTSPPPGRRNGFEASLVWDAVARARERRPRGDVRRSV